MKKPCIGIIGAGKVGSETANKILSYHLADCILFDASVNLAQARALDLSHSTPVMNSHVKITASGDFSLLKKCNVIVVTAGMPRKEGMTRDDLLESNFKIIAEVASNIKKYAADSIVIVVTNPLDTMTYALWKLSGLQPEKVIGMAGELDSARFVHYIATETNIASGNIDTLVLGSHGDLMVPLVSQTYIKSQPITKILSDKQIKIITEKTRDAGGEIVKLSGNGSGFYAAASCITEMINCILNDKREILCCSVKTSGEYNLDSVFIGLPAVIGRNGVEQIIKLQIPEKESIMLSKAAQHLTAMQFQVDNLMNFA